VAGETRQRILEATERLIELKGVARVTTRDIARETGLSEGSLYRHFDHKEDILFAVVSRRLPALFDAIQTHPAGASTLSENLTAVAAAVVRYYDRLFPISVTYLADKGLLMRYRETAQRINGGPQNIFTLVATYIEEEQTLGRIGRQITALNIATLLLGACHQRVFMIHLLGHDPFDKTDQQFAEELVQGLITSILPT